MSEKEEIAPKSLLGHWRTAPSGSAFVTDWIFHEDGTFTGTATHCGAHFSDFTGRWSLKGRTIHSVYTSDSSRFIRSGYKDRDIILEIASDYFLIETHHGDIRRYERVA
jgi:hypothetical protein